jgi:tRNA nucleotidyltransferase (CCA-adding enzyme)
MNHHLKKLLREVLDKIKPKEDLIKKIEEISGSFLNELNNLGIKAYLGGSVAKKTFLVNVKDIDVYLILKNEKEQEEIEKRLKNHFDNLKILKGSRNYYHIHYKGFLFECVPVLDIKKPEEAKNTTDISKFHVEFVKKELEKKPFLRDEILLFKYFLKQKELYGAESYIRGFSGYLSEVLVIKFGNFLNTLKFFSEVKKLPINIGINDKNKKLLKEQGKLNSFFNIIDPVLGNRNLGMALSKEKVLELIFHSKKFLLTPNFEKELKIEKIKKFWEKNRENIKGNYCLVEINADLTELGKKYNNLDIVGNKFLKTVEKIVNCLIENNFEVLDFAYLIDKDFLKGKFLILTSKYSKLKEFKGPSLFIKKGFLFNFVNKHNEDLWVFDYINERVKAFGKEIKNIDKAIKEIKKELEDLNSKMNLEIKIKN